MPGRKRMGFGAGLGVGLCLILGTTGAQGQTLQPLAFSRKTMIFGNMGLAPDTIRIQNPNTVDLICDSISLLPEYPQQLGYQFIQVFHPDSAYGRDIVNAAMGTGRGNARVFTHAETRLDFPKGRAISLTWSPYVTCPTCKRSAAESEGLRIRMVFHTSTFQDTVLLIRNGNFVVRIQAPATNSPASANRALDKERDLLGRHLELSGDRPRLPRTWSHRDL